MRKTFLLQGSPENLQALAVHGSVANFGNGTVVFLPFAKVAAAVS